VKAALTSVFKPTSPESPATNTTSMEITDSDSQHSQKTLRSTRLNSLKKMDRHTYKKPLADHFLRSDDAGEAASNCHLCSRKVRTFGLRGCSTCTRVYCCYCSLESERSAAVCRVCKGLCSCSTCYYDTFAADIQLIQKEACLDLS
jgi:hypothetical protein